MAKQQLKSFAELRTRANAWVKAKATAREATNALNKEATKLKNSYKKWLEEAELPPGTKVEFPDGRFSYTASVSETIDPRGWYNLWKSGDITEDEFFAAIKVGKAPAENAAGADLLAGITSEAVGKKRDIRFDELPRVEGREIVIAPTTEPKKAGIASRRPVVQPSASPPVPAGKAGPLRKLRMPANVRR